MSPKTTKSAGAWGSSHSYYLFEHCGYKEPHVRLKPADAGLNPGDCKLEVVGLTIVICGSQIICTERAQQQGQKQVQHLQKHMQN